MIRISRIFCWIIRWRHYIFLPRRKHTSCVAISGSHHYVRNSSSTGWVTGFVSWIVRCRLTGRMVNTQPCYLSWKKTPSRIAFRYTGWRIIVWTWLNCVRLIGWCRWWSFCVQENAHTICIWAAVKNLILAFVMSPVICPGCRMQLTGTATISWPA